MRALRLVCASPRINPAAPSNCLTFPLLLQYRALNWYRNLYTCILPNVMPLA